ncbi:MAG: LacI family DNA-binding transcriptional regulator [Rhodobacteraceae bacterium]|nr:LacI family DNA-binding transcriptional regulator [Paracoccaceae bacterium]
MTRKRVTLRDVAAAAGVHASTVSRALDPRTRARVNAAVVQRVVEISERLGYRPNAAAYSLRTSRSRTIGVIVPDIENPIFPPMVRGVERTLLAHGYYAILGNTDGDQAREHMLVKGFTARGIDGLVLASVNREDRVARDAALGGTPVVTVNRRLDDPTVSSVVHMEDSGVLRALTHLVSLGHRRIAVIAGPQDTSTGAERLESFLRHRETLGIADDPRLIAFAGAYSEGEGERCLEELIVRRAPFTAIFCANDRLAIGALAALGRRNVACPGDVSVVGYNDMPMVDRIHPPLTTVRVQQYQMGVEAAAILLAMIDGAGEARHAVLPVELVIRGSTRALAAAEAG